MLLLLEMPGSSDARLRDAQLHGYLTLGVLSSRGAQLRGCLAPGMLGSRDAQLPAGTEQPWVCFSACREWGREQQQ